MSDQSTGYPNTPPAPPAPPPPPQGQPPAPTATHEQLTQLNSWAQSYGAREKAEGRQQIEKEIAEKLGCTLDEAATFLKQAREAEQATMTEAQRLMTQAQEKDTKADAATAAAHKMIYDGLREDALVHAGMSRDQARLSRNMIHVDGEVTVESVVAAAQAVKLGFPQLFNASPPPPAGAGGNGAPGSTDRQQGGPVDSATRGTPPPGQGGGDTAKDRALARLRGEQGGRLRSDPLPPPPDYDYRRNT